MAIDYKQAGVDVQAGDRLVEWLKSHQPAKWPHQERLVSGIGGFAAVFRADFPEMKRPCIVSATDGVGTKVKLAAQFQNYDGIGQDLVAMCVNDLICCGASPLFFLDYYACGQLRFEAAKPFLASVQAACLQADCLLIGGETAEMPGVYQNLDFDCAGFAIGVVDEEKVLGSHRVKDRDLLIGVGSNGFHSNGYSLLRKVFADDLAQWKDELLKPTHLYVRLMKELLAIGGVHAVAHITGGGLDNLLRVLPDGFQAKLKPWPVPEPFLEVKRRAGLSWDSLLKTLNCGIGLILVVQPETQTRLLEKIKAMNFSAYDLGWVESSSLSEKSWQVDMGDGSQ